MKRIFVVSFISVGYFLNAQSLSNSPYAAYGIGDVKYDNTIETASMGEYQPLLLVTSPAVLILLTRQITPTLNLQASDWKLPTKTIISNRIITI